MGRCGSCRRWALVWILSPMVLRGRHGERSEKLYFPVRYMQLNQYAVTLALVALSPASAVVALSSSASYREGVAFLLGILGLVSLVPSGNCLRFGWPYLALAEAHLVLHVPQVFRQIQALPISQVHLERYDGRRPEKFVGLLPFPAKPTHVLSVPAFLYEGLRGHSRLLFIWGTRSTDPGAFLSQQCKDDRVLVPLSRNAARVLERRLPAPPTGKW